MEERNGLNLLIFIVGNVGYQYFSILIEILFLFLNMTYLFVQVVYIKNQYFDIGSHLHQFGFNGGIFTMIRYWCKYLLVDRVTSK